MTQAKVFVSLSALAHTTIKKLFAMSLREALVVWRKALATAPNNKQYMKSLGSLHTKAVAEEAKEAKERKKPPSPQKPSPIPDLDDSNHDRAQAAVNRIVANRAEQTKLAAEVR